MAVKSWEQRMARREHGHGTIFKREDGRWCGQVNVAPEGAARRRRTVYGKSRAEVVRKLGQVLEAKRKGDHTTSSPRFGIWLDDWLARADIKPRTRSAYRSAIEAHIKPVLGNVKLSNLRADHVHALHDSMPGLSPTTVRNVHRVAGAAMAAALEQQRAVVNPFTIVSAPAKADSDRVALSRPAVDVILARIKDTPMESRWLAALYLGMRQGECLGLTWPCVDLDNLTLDLTWQLQRADYRHGCGGKCSAKRGAGCPDRTLDVQPGFRYRVVEGNMILQRPKTAGSTRMVPIPEPMIAPLRTLADDYVIKRQAEGYHDHGLVWHRGNGRPLADRVDRQAWHALLAACKIPKAELHAARHTTATLLLENKVDPKIISSILGHSDVLTTRSYQHVDTALARDALDSLSRTAAIES